jgi:hypothetical protein
MTLSVYVKLSNNADRAASLRICDAFEIQPEQLVEGLFRKRRK